MPVEAITHHRQAADVLADSRAAIQAPARLAIDGLPDSLRLVAGYHLGWWDEEGNPVERTGKALRPALVLLAAEAVSGAAERAIPAAVAVELVHNSTLLHDDVIDQDVTRRHRPTAWRVFGRPAAILAGDALMVSALQLLTTHDDQTAQEAARLLGMAAQQVLGGQSMDIAFESRRDVGRHECVTMAQAKTSALLSAACALGALCGGGLSEQVEHLAAFGSRLGLAFQHVDDLLGIWGDPSVTGKPIYSDLLSRKKSLPVVAALTSETIAGRELAELYHRDDPLTHADAVRAAELIDIAGGRAWSRGQAVHLVAQAYDELAAANPTPRAAAELNALAQYVTSRDH